MEQHSVQKKAPAPALGLAKLSMAPVTLPGVFARKQELQHETYGCAPDTGSVLDSPTATRWQIPPSFLCPISQHCMHDPVVLSDGHTYERSHIELWLQKHCTSPVSGLHLPQRDLLPNHALRNAIEEYFQQVLSEQRRKVWGILSGLEEEQNLASSLASDVDSLIEWSLLMNAHLDTECVLLRMTDEAKTLLGAEAISVFLLSESHQGLVSPVNSIDGEAWAPVTVGIEGHVARSGEPLVIQDALVDERIDSTVQAKTGIKLRNVMCVPVRGKEGEILGVAQAINKTRAGELGCEQGLPVETDALGFTARDQEFLEVFAARALVAVVSASKLDVPPSPVVEPAHGYLVGEPVMKAPEKRVSSNDAGAEALLDRAFGSWQFDAFALAEVTGNRPLSALAEYLFKRLGYVQEFNLDLKKMSRFFAEIENGYDDSNPYHNRAHAASVLHAMHALLEHGGLMKAAALAFDNSEDGTPPARGAGLGDIERMACLLAAAIHDYDHVGLSNDFLVKTSHDRAVRYNDKHANEHHHAAGAFAVLLRPECNFLAQLPSSAFRRVRGLAIDLVLSTDMADNNAIVRSFTELLDARMGEPDSADEGNRASIFKPTTVAEASLLLQVAMKCADLGHLALDWDLHVRWVQLLEEEFFRQGDQEKSAGLPVSFLMDRRKPGASATQVGFFNFVVLPLFRVLRRAVPAVQPMLDGVTANYESWKEYEAQKAEKEDEHPVAKEASDNDDDEKSVKAPDA